MLCTHPDVFLCLAAFIYGGLGRLKGQFVIFRDRQTAGARFKCQMNVAVSFKSMALLWGIFTVTIIILSHHDIWYTKRTRLWLFEFLYMTTTWTFCGTVSLNECILSICGWFFSCSRDVQGPGIRLPESIVYTWGSMLWEEGWLTNRRGEIPQHFSSFFKM